MKIIFYISKGRNFKETLIFLKKKNLKIINKKNRELYFKTNKKNIYIIIIKNIDFKIYIKNNLTDFLFIGTDIIFNNNLNLFLKYKFLKINLFKLSLISNKNYKFSKNKNFIFWTKFKNIFKNYLNFKNIFKFKIKNIHGSSENMCIFKKNLILDIVSSGKTIKVNKLVELKNLINFKNILLYNINIIYNKIFLFMEGFYVKYKLK